MSGSVSVVRQIFKSILIPVVQRFQRIYTVVFVVGVCVCICVYVFIGHVCV